jgi:hypothetical protein
MVAIACPIDRETGAIRAPVAHGSEHARHHFAELRLKRLVLEKKTDDSAHSPTRRFVRKPRCYEGNGGPEPLSTARNNNFL